MNMSPAYLKGARDVSSQQAWPGRAAGPVRIALETARVYQLKLVFQEFWKLPLVLQKRISNNGARKRR